MKLEEHQPDDATLHDEMDTQTIALRVIAGLLLIGAAYLMSTVLLPFVLALVLAIALSPVANWMVNKGLPKSLASLACMLFVALILVTPTGLIIYQAGTVLQDSDQYLDRFSGLIADVSKRTGGDRFMQSLGVIGEVSPEVPSGEAGSADSTGEATSSSSAKSDDSSQPTDEAGASSSNHSLEFWRNAIRRNARALLRWVMTGLGGLAGVIGGVVIFLAYLFYMIQTRAEWIERVTLFSARLGLHPRHRQFDKIQHEIQTFIGCLSLVSLGYTILVTLILWLIGVPQPLLWGILAGFLEWIPYFGPLLAMILPTIVSLSLGTWWQPAAVVAQYVGLHALESYVVTPLLYGGAVRINPVTVLFGVLFFGWLWGPLGLATAMPVLILLRGILIMSPDTPALDALVEADEEKQKSNNND